MELLKLYMKPKCPLCDEVRQVLDECGAEWQEINIEDQPELWLRYRVEIPVVQSAKGSWFYRDRKTRPLEEWLQDH